MVRRLLLLGLVLFETALANTERISAATYAGTAPPLLSAHTRSPSTTIFSYPTGASSNSLAAEPVRESYVVPAPPAAVPDHDGATGVVKTWTPGPSLVIGGILGSFILLVVIIGTVSSIIRWRSTPRAVVVPFDARDMQISAWFLGARHRRLGSEDEPPPPYERSPTYKSVVSVTYTRGDTVSDDERAALRVSDPV